MSTFELTIRRVIIRAPLALSQEVDEITQAWFQSCGFAKKTRHTGGINTAVVKVTTTERSYV
jgi:hypothetical protein